MKSEIKWILTFPMDICTLLVVICLIYHLRTIWKIFTLNIAFKLKPYNFS